MTDSEQVGAYTDGDTSRSANSTLGSLIESRYSRRQALLSGFSATAAMFFGGPFLHPGTQA